MSPTDLTDEEIDAELEKIQQNITRTLQSIDQNFERCNQTITGSIIPEVDRFIKASREIWEHSKTWLYFFQMQAYGTTTDIQEQENSTNRPPFPLHTPTNTSTMDHTHPTSTLSGVWERLHRDLHRQRNSGFEQSSLGTDTMKGIYRPSRIVDRRNVNIAHSLHQQTNSSDDITTTHSSSMYAPTVRLLGIDDDTDSINNSSNNDMNPDDQQSSATRTSILMRGTPIDDFIANTTPTTISNISNNNKRKMDTGKSADTSSNTRSRFGENPMLQPHGSANRSTLMDRLEEAKQQSHSSANKKYQQHDKNPTPGPSNYSNNNYITNHLAANTNTTEHVSKNYNHSPKQNSILEGTSHGAKKTPIDLKDALSSPFFVAPMDRNQSTQQDTAKRTNQLLHSSHNKNIHESTQGSSMRTGRINQSDDFEFSQLQSKDDRTATPAPAPLPAPAPTTAPAPRQSLDRLTPSPFRNDYDANNDIDMAYEFSPITTRQAQDSSTGRLTPHSQRDTTGSQVSGYTTTASTSSMITTMSGVSGQIPAKFALHYFPEAFRDPPNSVQLTKTYNLFANRPGQMLRWRQVVDLMHADLGNTDDARLRQDLLRILLDMLTRKRFLRRIDKGWTLRC